MRRRLSLSVPVRPLPAGVLLFGAILLPATGWEAETYRIDYSKYRDISSIEQSVSIERIWGERLEILAYGTSTGDRNETLDRFRDSRCGDFRLGLLLTQNLKLTLSGEGKRRKDEGPNYGNQTMESGLSAGLTYSPSDYLSVSASMGPVSDQYERESPEADVRTRISNDGTGDSVLVTMAKGAAHVRFVQVGENREITNSRSRQLAGGVRGRIFDWVEGKLEAQGELSAEDYPTLSGEEKKDFRTVSGQFSLVAQPASRLRMELSTAMQGEEHSYASADNPEAEEKGREIRRRGVQCRLVYSPLDSLELDLKLGRTFRHRDYQKDKSDEYLDDKSFRGSVDYRFRAGSWIKVERTINLSSYDLPHRYNFDDRDLLNQFLGLTSQLMLPRGTSWLTKVSTHDNSIIYLESETSANNRRLTIYEFSNWIGFSPKAQIKMQNTVGIRADYTTYEFNARRNTLVRSLRLGSRLTLAAGETHSYEGDYLLTVEDRGAYLLSAPAGGWRYRKDTQILKHELSLSLPLIAQETFALVPFYRLKSTRTFGYLPEGAKEEQGTEDEHHLGTTGSLLFSKGSLLELSLDRIIKKDNPFWDLDASLTYNL